MSNYTSLWAELIIEECVRLGVTTWCVCPGSRSTPLTVAAARHKRVKILRAYDERAAAFLALGFGRATGKPAVVVTTSGTAVPNLYPAVVEAAQDRVPLLLLTADRPAELLDNGANQAIRQTGLFAPYLRWQFDLPCPGAEMDAVSVLTTVDQAVYRCGSHHAGPVHLNCHYREPFYGPEDITLEAVSALATWREQTTPLTRYSVDQLTCQNLDSVLACIHKTKRGLLIVGQLQSEAEQTAARSLALQLNWPVYADLRSGLRLESGTQIWRYFDQDRLSSEFNEQVRPEVVLHLGARVISKRVPLYFQQYPPEHYIFASDSPERQDPVHGVSQRLVCDLTWLAETLCEKMNPAEPGDYLDLLCKKANAAHDLIHAAIDEDTALTEPWVACRLTESVPPGSAFFVANSMPVRDVDIYGTLDRLDDVHIGVNRGASGIDGTIASALGFAQGKQVPTTLLIGDQAFIHDLNSLSLLREVSQPLVIVVINNSGGGIFHFLPIAEQTDVFEPYFKMPHDFKFKGVCETFGIAHVQPADKEAFDEAYQQVMKSGQSTVIEVVTVSQDNFAFRKDLKEKLLEMLQQNEQG